MTKGAKEVGAVAVAAMVEVAVVVGGGGDGDGACDEQAANVAA